VSLLELEGLNVAYGRIRALRGITLAVEEGQIVTLIGANGAGKTTTMKTVSGLLAPQSGRMTFDGEDLTKIRADLRVRRGICQVPEGRGIFPGMTVLENLDMGGFVRKDKAGIQKEMDYVFGIFPRLQERQKQVAGTLSGGEQQMLAIGRALMSKPRFLMLDEPSLGIAPLLVKTIFEKIVEINRQQGISILLVEQNANLALEISRYGYVLETGRIILQDQSAALRQNPQVKSAYLGGV
jgi:branched-chain amino acid transport system ATP-binding protein